MSEKKKKDKIEFKTKDEVLKLNFNEVNRGKIEKVIEIEKKAEEENYVVQTDQEILRIAPRHIKDYEIKKPDEEEPSLFEILKNKLKNNHNINKDQEETKIKKNTKRMAPSPPNK